MIKISNITIKRFRSIIDMSLPISLENNMISICGQNNVGKTNTLRAINLFFHPELYDRQIDMPSVTGLEPTLVSLDNFTRNCSKFLENTTVLSS